MSKLLFKNFDVEVLRVIDSTEEAWLTSKPTIKYDDSQELKATVDSMCTQDLPLSAFKQYHLKIRSSILFRDLIFCVRPCIAWGSSFRINPIREGNIYQEFEAHYERDSRFASDCLDVAYEEFAKGVPLDKCKVHLPLSTITEYTMSIDSRTLMCIAATLDDVDPLGFKPHVTKLCNVLGFSNISELPKGTAKSLYHKLCVGTDYLTINFSKLKPEVDFPISEYFVHSDYCAELRVIVDASTGGQFLRQHFSHMRSQLWNFVALIGYRDTATSFKCDDRFAYVATGQIESFEQLIRRRVCHVVHWDHEFKKSGIISWSDILKPMLVNVTPKEFAKLLPCRCNYKNCSVDQETRLRLWKEKGVSGTVPDENPVCPILVGDPTKVQERIDFYNSDSIIADKWKSLVDEGFIKERETSWKSENEK